MVKYGAKIAVESFGQIGIISLYSESPVGCNIAKVKHVFKKKFKLTEPLRKSKLFLIISLLSKYRCGNLNTSFVFPICKRPSAFDDLRFGYRPKHSKNTYLAHWQENLEA